MRAETSFANEEELSIDEAIRLNILHQVKVLETHEALRELCETGKLRVTGLYYDQYTGLLQQLNTQTEEKTYA